MPIPKPLISDSELQARMSGALMAWRRISHGIAQAYRTFGAVAASDNGMLDDLEKVAHAFDAWPAAWSHIEDLRAELAKVPEAPAPAPAAPDLSPPWVLFTDNRKPKAILPAGRPGEVADVSGLDLELVQSIVRAANLLADRLHEAKLERLFADMRSLFERIVPVSERGAALDKVAKRAGVDRREVARLMAPKAGELAPGAVWEPVPGRPAGPCRGPYQMDAPGGPICSCGRPSRHESGWCGLPPPCANCGNSCDKATTYQRADGTLYCTKECHDAAEGLCAHGNPEATMYCLDCMSERPGGPCGRCGGPTLDCVVDSLCPKCDPIKTREQTLEEAQEVFRSTRCTACGGPKCMGDAMCDNCGLKAARAESPK